MPSPEELANRAYASAQSFLDSEQAAIVSAAGDDLELLRTAAEILTSRRRGGRATGTSAEHIAFSLITAAFEEIRTRLAPSPPSE